MDFNVIREAVENHFREMCKDSTHLYEVNLDKDVLWNTYLESIPSEENKIYKVRREYDCSCCRHFIKSIGNVVSIKDGKLTSIWDFETKDQRWNAVAKSLSEYVKQNPISDVYLTKFGTIGTAYNMMATDDGTPIKWEHFCVKVPEKFIYKEYLQYLTS